jgi:hypothetical protein
MPISPNQTLMKTIPLPKLGRRVIAAAGLTQEAENFHLPETPEPRRQDDITNRRTESGRILKRLLIITGDHSDSAQRLGVEIQNVDMQSVIEALRSHAKGNDVQSIPGQRGEIHQHVLDSLFSEVVEEPSHIFFTTTSGVDSIRYDAMESSFWIECLDLLEHTLCEELTSKV